jgi:hypothetical protein
VRGPARLAIALSAVALASCGGQEARAPAVDRTQPHWEDAFDRSPDILVLLHPKALTRDPTYGPLLKNVSRIVAARAPQTAGTRAIEVFESSDEVIFGLRKRATNDALVVLRGVRADVEPVKLVDDKGAPMWGELPNRRSKFMEYERKQPGEGSGVDHAGQAPAAPSLFALPLRTWVIATGDARARARDAFEHPVDRPAPAKDDSALFLVRLDGPALIEGVPRLRAKGGALEPMGRHLVAVTAALRPGSEGLIVTFLYDEDAAAALAEQVLKQVASALASEGSEKTKWLGDAKVSREATTITARVTLPRRLIEELPQVTAAELGF